MEKKIVVCIGTDRASGVRARLSLMIVDGAQVIAEHYHSVTLSPGDDLAEVRGQVEQHLAMEHEQSGIPAAPWSAIPDEEWRKVEGVCAIFHTEELVAAARARKAEEFRKYAELVAAQASPDQPLVLPQS